MAFLPVSLPRPVRRPRERSAGSGADDARGAALAPGKDAKHPELLYQKDYINRFGLTADTKEPYAAVVASWLTGHRDLWMGVAHGLYRLVEGNRVSIMMKDPDLQRIRKQRVFPPFGEVLPVALVLLGNRSQELGRPSMLLYDGNPSGTGTYSLVRALEGSIPPTACFGAYFARLRISCWSIGRS